MEHRYSSGYAAARADGWCVSCFWHEALPDAAVCEDCRVKRNQRSRKRNELRPCGSRTRKKMLDAFGHLADNHRAEEAP